MAHFAEIDQNNQVIRVVVINNADTLDQDGKESEAAGITFCQSLFGQENRWVQTSYNGKIRKHYAGSGYIYDKALDAFIPPKPYPSWVLDESLCVWLPPTPKPQDEHVWSWDEDSLAWVQVDPI